MRLIASIKWTGTLLLYLWLEVTGVTRNRDISITYTHAFHFYQYRYQQNQIMILHCYVLISLLEINFKLDTGRNNSDEQYNAMLVLRVINYMMTINDEFDLIDVINGKILFLRCVIAIMYSLEYGMQYYLLLMKIQNMLPHITIKLSVIHTISYQLSLQCIITMINQM